MFSKKRTHKYIFDEFSDLLYNVVLCNQRLLIVGDFNIHMDNLENSSTIQMNEILHMYGLQQHVKGQTQKCFNHHQPK